MRRLSPSEARRWLAQPALFADSPDWEAGAWIVHAMYESPELSGLTYDDLERHDRAERSGGPAWDLLPPRAGELLAALRRAGSGIGRSRSPGPGWRRLRWVELCEGLGVDPLTESPRSIPPDGWRVSIAPPSEGSLDREQFLRLVDRLADATPGRRRAPCRAYYDMYWEDVDPGGRVLFAGRLGELVDLYDDESLPGSPIKIWPADRSWLVHTDVDAWGTTVSGSADLIARLTADPDLETLPFP